MKTDNLTKTITGLFLLPLAQFVTFSFAAAYLSGGFIAGIFLCSNCSLAEPISYLVVSFIIGILSLVTGGFPSASEGGGGAPLNTWPFYTIVLGALGSYPAGCKNDIHEANFLAAVLFLPTEVEV